MHAFCANVFAPKKSQRQNVTRKKLLKALSYKKILSKMLMKLTPSVELKHSFHEQLLSL